MVGDRPCVATDLLVDNVEIDGRGGQSVLVSDGLVQTVGPRDAVRAGVVGPVVILAGNGCALLPGLHDHHIHLFAAASRADSIWCGPPDVNSPDELEDRLRQGAEEAGRDRWLRAVGWDDTTAGWPDRTTLDRAVADRPVRLQHRSGALWVLNSLAIDELELGSVVPEGVETDDRGAPTGRFFGVDDWLRSRIGAHLPSLADLGAELAARGVTGVTDATATNGATELEAFAAARRRNELVQNVVAMTGGLDVEPPEGIVLGPIKVVLAEAALPGLDDVVARIAAAHAAGRRVAVHAVDRASLVLAVAAFAEAGAEAGDRIEHASVTPPEMLAPLDRLGLTVVTQPNFIADHGDRYVATVDEADLPWLYRGRAFIDAGVAFAAGSDAPFGSLDPWHSLASAVSRLTASGRVLGAGEQLRPGEALGLFTGEAMLPGTQRKVAPGRAADLCLLDRTRSSALSALADVGVAATVIGGGLVYNANGGLRSDG